MGKASMRQSTPSKKLRLSEISQGKALASEISCTLNRRSAVGHLAVILDELRQYSA